ncbi:MAG: type II secretion system major pseudopilin GspG [Victivallaceae bacterium]|nr:type II secretion system major pseudopilin GspG [Victivallaceae bacterium]MDD4180061.1 type II secretion system major pseudopilin GspG [Victivallaceae bacterium]
MKKRKLKVVRFTLIEIVVVIVILVMLASIATPLYMRHISSARISTAATQIKLLEQSLMDFKLDMGKYPDTADGLRVLVENINQEEKWKGPYIKPNVPKDPWGNEYNYVCPGEHGEFDLSSYGADGQPDGEGEDADITNWK